MSKFLGTVGRRRLCIASKVVSLAALLISPALAAAAAFDGYTLTGSFVLPPGASTFDVHPDGRIFALAGNLLYGESDPGSHNFLSAGVVPGADFSSFGAGFLRFSPDGGTFAVGNGGGASFSNYQVGVFDSISLTGRWLSAGHFDAEWADTTHLALTAGTFGQPAHVSLLDTASADPLNPANPMVVNGIGGASGGIAFDAAGGLFTANGFSTTGPSGTGEIRYFGAADWQAAATGTPLDFELVGTMIADVLSAVPLIFDTEDNLLIGGSDFFGTDRNFAALVHADVITRAIAGGSPADVLNVAELRRLDPDGSNDSNIYDVNYNPASGELLLRDGATVYVYAVPEPATAVLLLLGAATLSLHARGRRESTGCACSLAGCPRRTLQAEAGA